MYLFITKLAKMNTPDKKALKKKDIPSPRIERDDAVSSSLDTFPMQAALGIYTMNRHTEDTENRDR